ncbi:hypothetical protein ORJ04_17995 [Rheinheimera baltica]|uniref:Uncharacterized protein n=1 Tax=Rheinheimera baltica TaxID=67576 RepID=A0ABT9I3A2_9GAMM|nr:hypothetical protein [Rheinheimera baltica]MDP5137849.1 hypothetical protein [Rheinheimera baltica]
MILDGIDYKRVTPELLQQFISDLGWKKIREYDDQTSVWKSDSYGNAFWLPPCNKYDDFPFVVSKILTSLSQVMGVSPSEFSDILVQYYNDKDLIKLRVVSEDVKKGSIQISDGTKLYESLQTLIEAASRRISGVTKDIRDLFSSDTLLGQTEVGSYVVKTYTPVIYLDESIEQNNIIAVEKKAIGRQILDRLIRRLSIICDIYKSVNSQSPMDDVVSKLVENGFTKNECIAIENLFGNKGHRDWELKVYWAKQVDSTKLDSFIKFDHAFSSAAGKVVDYLKAVDSDKSNVTVEGRVTGLERDYDEDLGTVKLRSIIKGKECTVTLNLNERDFQIAHSANASRSSIEVSGELTETKIGRRTIYQMQDIDELKLIPTPENFEMRFDED